MNEVNEEIEFLVSVLGSSREELEKRKYPAECVTIKGSDASMDLDEEQGRALLYGWQRGYIMLIGAS